MKTSQWLTEKNVRKWVRQILEEHRRDGTIKESHASSLYDTFVKPFATVVQAAHVGVKDILSVAKLNFDLMTAFTSAAIKEAEDNYAQRKQAIDQEWGEVMKEVDANLGSGDAAIVMFMLDPATYTLGKVVDTLPDAAKAGKEYLEDIGFDAPSLGISGASASRRRGQDPVEKDKGLMGKATGLLGDITKLFFVAHHAPTGPLLSEAEKDEKKPKEKKVNKDQLLRDHFDEIGLTQKAQEDAAEYIDALEEMIDTVLDEVTARAEVLALLKAVTTFDEFKQALQTSAKKNLDLTEGGIQQLDAKIEADVKKMLTDPEAREELIRALSEKEGKKLTPEDPVPEIPDAKLALEAEEVVFMTAKEDLQSKLSDPNMMKKIKENALEVINKATEGMPRKKDFEGPSADSPMVQEYLDVLEGVEPAIDTALQKSDQQPPASSESV
jgi:hypothetical protein